MSGINRQKVRRSFDSNAGSYEAYANVQKEIVLRQIDLLRRYKRVPRVAVDIGCGTGMLLRQMTHMFPHASLLGVDLAFRMVFAAKRGLPNIEVVNADAEKLPLRTGSCDLVVSTSTFQWLQPLQDAFSEVFRILAPGGTFHFSLFGEKTLQELRESYRCACYNVGKGNAGRVHRFIGVDEVVSGLERCGMGVQSMETEMLVEHHRDVPDLLRSLKKIGAGNATSGKTAPATRQVMLEMMHIYRNEYGSHGRIPASYEVIHGVAEKAGSDQLRI